MRKPQRKLLCYLFYNLASGFSLLLKLKLTKHRMEVVYATALPGLYVLLTHSELNCCQIWDQKEIPPHHPSSKHCGMEQRAALPCSAKEVIPGALTKFHTMPALCHSCHTHSPTLHTKRTSVDPSELSTATGKGNTAFHRLSQEWTQCPCPQHSHTGRTRGSGPWSWLGCPSCTPWQCGSA